MRNIVQVNVKIPTNSYTVEPRFNEPLLNELLGITNNNFRPGKRYRKMYETEPRFNEPRFNKPISAAQT